MLESISKLHLDTIADQALVLTNNSVDNTALLQCARQAVHHDAVAAVGRVGRRHEGAVAEHIVWVEAARPHTHGSVLNL